MYIILDDCLQAGLAPSATKIEQSGIYVKTTSTYAKDLNEYLTTAGNWNEFASGAGGSSATGSPTLAQLNTSLGSELAVRSRIDSTLSNYSLYVPDNGGESYWLATMYGSPSTTSNQDLVRGINGLINMTSANTSNLCGIRPVVCLSSGVTGTVGDSSVTLDK